ncbi:pyrroloquinoline quinone biosynthesis peptide chaperone PqqD [Erwinia sp. SLM-02]|uniref:pyrroloquinoline quinone biosynthesis peptide chaperone PqqD n=1 Tax=Erwinia sp. SLM-02 TaxID=3020057 RepID=UPI0028D48562|nr:pyrroloquinoline quinone biosynthesis peptide chaperone PqqD [uncultured Erwinia sp.]
MSNPQTIPMFRRGYRLQWEEVQNCHVILYPEGMAKLNDSATAILELVDGKRTLADIIQALNDRFPEAGGVDNDVQDFFAQAREQKWIILRDPA